MRGIEGEEDGVPPIRCHYPDCIYLDEGFCGAVTIELEPDDGCLTYERSEETLGEDSWDEEEELGDLWHGDEEMLYEDADDEDWYQDDDSEELS